MLLGTLASLPDVVATSLAFTSFGGQHLGTLANPWFIMVVDDVVAAVVAAWVVYGWYPAVRGWWRVAFWGLIMVFMAAAPGVWGH